MTPVANAENKTVSASCGETVELPSGLQTEEMALRWDDIRWFHHQLGNRTICPSRDCEQLRRTRREIRLLSLKKNVTTCVHGRCMLLNNGSLRFSIVQAEDSGKYTLEVFYENGTARTKKDFELQVEGESMSPETQTNTTQN